MLLLVIVPVVALPFCTPSTNHEIAPVPPVNVAVNVCGCEVVTAAIPGARETLPPPPPPPPPEPPPEPPPDPPPEPPLESDEEFPPQEIIPGENRAKTKASNRIRLLIFLETTFRPRRRRCDELCSIDIFSIKASPRNCDDRIGSTVVLIRTSADTAARLKHRTIVGFRLTGG